MSKFVKYYKATDGVVTMFRRSETREYKSASIKGSGFSGSGPGAGWVPAQPISKAEYDRLVELKKARTDSNAPSASWIWNSALALPDREG